MSSTNYTGLCGLDEDYLSELDPVRISRVQGLESRVFGKACILNTNLVHIGKVDNFSMYY